MPTESSPSPAAKPTAPRGPGRRHALRPPTPLAPDVIRGKEAVLSRKRPLPRATRRYLRAWLAATRYRLSNIHGADAELSVHEYRVGLKRLRSFLRLMRGALTTKQFRRANVALRDAGRALSAVRDQAVVRQTASALLGQTEPGAPLAPAAGSQSPSEQVRRTAEDDALTRELLAELATFERRALRWSKNCNSLRILRRGFLRGYEEARQRMAAAQAAPTSQSLHEWRKLTKHHLYQLQALAEWWPKSFAQRKARAKELAEVLGALNDLTLLRATLKTPDGSRLSSGEPHPGSSATERLETEQRRLMERAFALGAVLYAESDKKMKRRLKRYLR